MPAREQGTVALASLREEIDDLDARIVELLARRMEVVERVVAIKDRDGIPALLPGRVEEVVGRVRAKAEAAGMPPDLADAVWRRMIEWIVDYENARLDARGTSGP